MHDRAETGGVVADRLVDEEQAPRAALRHEAADVVEAGDQPCAVHPLELAGEPLSPACVRVIAGERLDLAWSWRKVLDRGIAAFLEDRDAELLEHRLDAPGVEARDLVAVDAVAMPCPARQVDGVPRLPIDALPV